MQLLSSHQLNISRSISSVLCELRHSSSWNVPFLSNLLQSLWSSLYVVVILQPTYLSNRLYRQARSSDQPHWELKRGVASVVFLPPTYQHLLLMCVADKLDPLISHAGNLKGCYLLSWRERYTVPSCCCFHRPLISAGFERSWQIWSTK